MESMQEYLDVLDDEGTPTGEKKLRSLVHQDSDWHRLVFVWVMNPQGELLIQKRSMEKDINPGKWDVACGGHVAAGDTSINTAIRELKEELGIDTSENSLEFLFTVKGETKHKGTIEREFSNVYLLRSDVLISKLKLQKEEVGEVKYLPWREVESMIMKRDDTFAPRYEQYEKFFKLLNNP